MQGELGAEDQPTTVAPSGSAGIRASAQSARAPAAGAVPWPGRSGVDRQVRRKLCGERRPHGRRQAPAVEQDDGAGGRHGRSPGGG